MEVLRFSLEIARFFCNLADTFAKNSPEKKKHRVEAPGFVSIKIHNTGGRSSDSSFFFSSYLPMQHQRMNGHTNQTL